jgi:hypothetical protein
VDQFLFFTARSLHGGGKSCFTSAAQQLRGAGF